MSRALAAFPRPVLSVMLALTWLLLQQSLALPQLITAALLGWGLPQLLHGLLGSATATARRLPWGVVLRFTLIVLWDIVVSNFAVAKLVLWPAARPQPAWVPIPLDISHPSAIVLLAAVITTTPGTVSCTIDEAGRMILVHALDCSDPAEMAAQIKQRYEQALKEIFE